MSIDLRQVEPLGSKSLLLEQALRRQRGRQEIDYDDYDMSDMVAPDYEWLKEDKSAIQGLVKQMDASIGQLSKQMHELENRTERSRAKLEKEQQLLYKQIRTLNGLMKRQVDIFSSVERQAEEIEIKNNNLIPQVGIGLIAGLMSAVTILVTAPWMTVLIDMVRAG
ncbi:hypothetical protein [Thiomicrospira sp. WB1]|jgi:predicted RNase H-like nuclease (RuvC/YqgF family)|uniref:hypothetical protein n=1 Tax=Thiomicrospira sp. WB1 TaxID=1685380 RepID=UPI0007495740|nr:hypothetical protein [Thiomicrospira sp. WB1]KUJ72720.1 hypothetical protein AVO41_02700 [Thiomicrospira sp. WB1]